MTSKSTDIQKSRCERLRAIVERHTEEIHDPELLEQLEGRARVPRYAAVTSADSGFAPNGRVLLVEDAEGLANLLRGEAADGWIAHGLAWDLDGDWAIEGNLGYDYEVRVKLDGAEAWSSVRAAAESRVWVCTYEHRHGLDAWAAASATAAYRSFAETIRSFWAEALEAEQHICDEERPPLPAEPPADDRKAVERYFEVMGEAPRPEFFSIECQPVVGDGAS